METDQLFDESCRPKVREFLSKERGAAAAELEVRQPDEPLGVRFLLLAVPGEQLLVAAASGAGYTEEMGAKLMAANSELARLTRELSRRIRELDTAKQALLNANETEQRLRAELEELDRAGSAVSEAVADLPGSDISAVLYMIALQAQALTHAEYVALGIGTNAAKRFHPWVFIGVPEEIAHAIGSFPRPVATLGTVARDGRVIRIGDVHRHPDFRGFPPQHPEMGSLLGVPILHRGRPVGNLYLGNKPGAPEFSEQQERLVRMLAARVAVAIETATLYTTESLQRTWLQNIIDQMPDGVLLYDEHGRLKAMNQAIVALCDQTGLKDSDGAPALCDARKPDGSVVPAEELPPVRALRDREATMHEELLLRRRDGSFAPASVSAVPVRGAAGDISGVMMIVQDISGRKELERLREEWAAIVAHDLRQPVSTISLAAESLLRFHAGELPDPQRRTFERIRSASGRLNRMITDLSDASQIESKRLSLEPRLVDLGSLIDAVVESLDEATAGYDVHVTVEKGQLAWIDPDRIHQVLGNLLSNATKYGQPGTQIRIDAVTRDDFAEVIVTNHGRGIPPDQLPLLFSRFTRTRGARESRAPGLGLGLYIAKGLVEAHGGHLWGESVPGETTSFHFTVPRSPRVPQSRAEAASPAPLA